MVSTFRNNNDDNEDSNMGATGQAGGLNPVFLVSKQGASTETVRRIRDGEKGGKGYGGGGRGRLYTYRYTVIT